MSEGLLRSRAIDFAHEWLLANSKYAGLTRKDCENVANYVANTWIIRRGDVKGDFYFQYYGDLFEHVAKRIVETTYRRNLPDWW